MLGAGVLRRGPGRGFEQPVALRRRALTVIAPNSDDLLDMYKKSRAEGFGAEVKRRILIGTYVLSHGYYDAYYLQAGKTAPPDRRGLPRAYEVCDLVMGRRRPSAFQFGAKSDDPVKMYLNDIFTICANLTGQPAMSHPAVSTTTVSRRHAAVIGNYLDEARMLNARISFNWRRARTGGLGAIRPSEHEHGTVGSRHRLETHVQL